MPPYHNFIAAISLHSAILREIPILVRLHSVFPVCVYESSVYFQNYYFILLVLTPLELGSNEKAVLQPMSSMRKQKLAAEKSCFVSKNARI